MSAPRGLDGRAGLARSGLVALVGSVVNGVAALGVVLAVTRGLGDADAAGTVFTAIAVFNIAYLVSSLGADVAVVRAVAGGGDERAVIRTALFPTLVLSIAVAAVLVAARHRLDGAIDGSGGLAGALLVLAPLVPAAAATTVFMAATRGRGTMVPTAVVERITRPGVQLAALGAAGLVGAGVTGTVAAWSVGFGLVAAPAIAWTLRTGQHPLVGAAAHGAAGHGTATSTAAGHARGVGGVADHIVPAGVTIPGYWSFALPQAAATVFQVALRWADVVLVAALADPAGAAVYTAASRLLLAGNFVNLAVVQAVSPMIRRALARGDRDGAEDLLRTGAAWLVCAVWPGYFLLIAFGHRVLGVFGDGYDEGWAPLAVLCAAMLVASAVGPIEAVLSMSGGSRLALADNAAAVVVNVTLNVLLIPRLGIEGAALAWAAGLLTTNLAPLVQVRRRLGIDPFGPGLRRVATIAACAVLAPGVAFRLLVDPGLASVVAISVVAVVVYGLVLSHAGSDLHIDELRAAVRPGRRQRVATTDAGAPNSGSLASVRYASSASDEVSMRQSHPRPAGSTASNTTTATTASVSATSSASSATKSALVPAPASASAPHSVSMIGLARSPAHARKSPNTSRADATEPSHGDHR